MFMHWAFGSCCCNNYFSILKQPLIVTPAGALSCLPTPPWIQLLYDLRNTTWIHSPLRKTRKIQTHHICALSCFVSDVMHYPVPPLPYPPPTRHVFSTPLLLPRMNFPRRRLFSSQLNRLLLLLRRFFFFYLVFVLPTAAARQLCPLLLKAVPVMTSPFCDSAEIR